MNKNLLKSIIVRNGDSGKSLAGYLNMTNGTFSRKINERKGAEFTVGEILKIRTKYQLSATDIDQIFFT
ncbi:toxin-antitoxin system, antitoxin component, Xre family [Oribacterium sp. oral taxon 078 str. F0263]|uniref:hypothetical protein n=1 Tax=Oribacterium sp. oral taxon 078 TaxID=652706 RepID=UPI0003ADA9B8|nr:hypothetical protein [Oribacterium sp. oral taxon 078]ERL22707.1 toxin-antitoxin system, antitoxin component, Xre family [Oribacterium sp. oral taxon 078 str. F0263]